MKLSRKYHNLNNYLKSFIRNKVVNPLYYDEVQNLVSLMLIRTNWYWFKEIYPYAFTAGARIKRKYKLRTGKYQKVKTRILFSRGKYDPRPKNRGPLHPAPLPDAVWTGNFKRMTLAAPKKNPWMKSSGRGGVYNCSIKLQAPQYVKYQKNRINVLAEVTRLMPEDQKKMIAYFRKRLIPGLQGYLVDAHRL